jgi:TolB protein
MRFLLVQMSILSLLLAVAADTVAQSRPLSLAYQLTYSYTVDNAPSPDGQRLVFIRRIEGWKQLFLMSSDGSGEVQLTRDPANHEDPAWSADGRKIAFVLVTEDSKTIVTMNPDGTGLEAITPKNQRAIHPSWTPDNRSILYCTDDDLRPPVKNEAEIYAVDVATKRVTTLISGGVNTFPAMSPDGSRIAFRRMVGETNSEVFVADADGSNPQNLTNHPAFEGWPAWSPDGSEIAFAGNRNSAYQVFVMKADGSDVRLVANTEGRATTPRWSPDGSRIYFTNCKHVDFGRGCEIMVAPLPASSHH